MIALSKQINMTTYLWIANQKAILSPGANPHPLTFTFVELRNEYQMWRQHLVSVTNSLFFSESHMGAPSIVIRCDRNPQNTCCRQEKALFENSKLFYFSHNESFYQNAFSQFGFRRKWLNFLWFGIDQGIHWCLICKWYWKPSLSICQLLEAANGWPMCFRTKKANTC